MRHVAKQIEKFLLDELSPRGRKLMFEHIKVCPDCRFLYEKLVRAERALCGAPNTPSIFELERGASMLRGIEPEKRKPSWGLQVATLAAVTCLMLVAGLTALIRSGWKPDRVEVPAPELFTSKGGEAGADFSGIRAYRVFREPFKYAIEELIPADRPGWQGSGKSTLSPDDVLVFTYTNMSGLDRLFLFGIDQEYSVKWYYPQPPEQESVRIEKNVVDRILPFGIEVKVNHRKGPLRIYAIFSDCGINAVEVRKWVGRMKKDKIDLDKAHEILSNCATIQQSFFFEVGGD